MPRNVAYIQVNHEKILPEFLTCFFLSDFSKRQCAYSGGGNIQGLISLKKLKKFVVPVPNLKIQKHFADIYTKAISLQSMFLQIIRESVSSFYKILGLEPIIMRKTSSFGSSIDELVKRRLWTPNLHDPYPDKVLKKISRKAALKNLLQIATIKKGNEIGSINYQDYLQKSKRTVPFVRTSDIFNYEIDSFPDFYASEELFHEYSQDFQPGDVIVNNEGKIGFPAIITKEDKAIYQSHIKRLRSKFPKEVPNEYIFLCLLLPEIGEIQFKKFTVVQSTIPTLSKRIGLIEIPMIGLSVRKRIAGRIKKAYTLVEEKKRLIKKIKFEINQII